MSTPSTNPTATADRTYVHTHAVFNESGLTPRQINANAVLANQRHSLLVGGSRSGKTYLIIRAICIRAFNYAGSRHAVLRFRANAAKESIWLDTLPKVLKTCFTSVPIEWHNQDKYIVFPNGSEIWVGGLDDKERVEKILGKEFATEFFNECSQIPYNSVQLALTRLAQKVPGCTNRAFYDLNPTGTSHWTYRLFIQHKTVDGLSSLPSPSDFGSYFLNPRDNLQHIDPQYIKTLEVMPERYRKRFLEGEYVAELDNALWSLSSIEQSRVQPPDVPVLTRIVVAVDPSGAAGDYDIQSDQIGIVVAGISQTGEVYILEDATLLCSPEKWGSLAVQLYDRYRADLIVAESNFGGDMVRAVIQNTRRLGATDPCGVPVRLVTASRGKVIRAEPIAVLSSQGKIHHVGFLPMLEDELCNFTTSGYMGSASPNRADAMIWAATELASRSQVMGWNDLIKMIDRNIKDGVYKSVEEAVIDNKDNSTNTAGAAGTAGTAEPVKTPISMEATLNAPVPIIERVIDKVLRTVDLYKPLTAQNQKQCPECNSLCITKLPAGDYRCNSCGVQYGSVQQIRNPSRGEYMDLVK